MNARIPTESRRQAMDWSLVLISQGIEAVIESDAEAGWGLLVPAGDHERSLAVLEQYRRENFNWPWRQRISGQGLLFDWGSLAWVALIAFFFWLQTSAAAVGHAGAMDAAAVSRGEWWRLFTPVFLHGDIGHLAMNAAVGLVLLGLAMGRYGTGVGLFAAYLAGAGGSVATWLAFRDHHSVGASGMVMGCVGLLTAQSFPLSRKNRVGTKYAITGLIGGGLLFALIGLGSRPGTDFLAHFGGFAAGLVLGAVLTLFPQLTRPKSAQAIAGSLFTGLVVVTWWLALR